MLTSVWQAQNASPQYAGPPQQLLSKLTTMAKHYGTASSYTALVAQAKKRRLDEACLEQHPEHSR